MYKTFEELPVWQKAHEIALLTYSITNFGAIKNDFSLKDQMRRAAVSVSSNIAEGHDRKSIKEYVRFLCIAKGSAAELRSQFYLARDLAYISQEDYSNIDLKLTEVNRMIAGFMKYLQSRIE